MARRVWEAATRYRAGALPCPLVWPWTASVDSPIQNYQIFILTYHHNISSGLFRDYLQGFLSLATYSN